MSDPIAPAAPQSAASRLAFLVLGLMTLGVGLIITIGAAIAGLLAIALAGYASSRRGRNLTRRKAWLVSVGATVGLLFVVLSTAILTDDSNTRPQTAEERAEARSKVEQEMPEWIRAMRPNAGQQAAAADSMADRLLQNRAIVIWGGLMGAVIASTMMGTIAGTFAWAGAMLFYRGMRGRWMTSAADPASALA